ncbi:hypothetical protein A0128_03870 [Leptospira tipperaryensis]|uniref:Lipoprotein n=1 Tax=Leptospira tipperaryensis TaxID=2564040 RepID=A0A1D7UTY7_9LEPT|nr:hypothetical protein [Leptospira tipperaryensis]AOP33070.1 hypothetical protein A0128_03870 [Leptospira tipperaryensis]
MSNRIKTSILSISIAVFLFQSCFTVFPKGEKVVATKVLEDKTTAEESEANSLEMKLNGEKLTFSVRSWIEKKNVRKMNLVDSIRTEQDYRLSDKFKVFGTGNEGVKWFLLTSPLWLPFMLLELPTLPFRLMSDQNEKIESSEGEKIRSIPSKGFLIEIHPSDNEENKTVLDLDKGKNSILLRTFFDEIGQDGSIAYDVIRNKEKVVSGVFSISELAETDPKIENFLSKLLLEKNQKMKTYCEKNFRKFHHFQKKAGAFLSGIVLEAACEKNFPQDPIAADECKQKYHECVPFLNENE